MKTILVVPFEFIASHSLSGFEEPHPHLWKFEARITGNPVEGRIIDLATLCPAIENFIAPFKNAYLNNSDRLPKDAANFPTSETLSQSFYDFFETQILPPFKKQNPSIQILSIQLSLCDLDGKSMGGALIQN